MPNTLPRQENQLTEHLSASETKKTSRGKSSKQKSYAASTWLDVPEPIVKLSMNLRALSGQANLIIVGRRLIRTKVYHKYKEKIAAHVATAMWEQDTLCGSRGDLYRVDLSYSCGGWGVDVDNSCKAILDALIGVALDDDRAIVQLNITKNTHSRKEGIQIEVWKIGFREVSDPVAKVKANKTGRTRANPVRPNRTRRIRKAGAE